MPWVKLCRSKQVLILFLALVAFFFAKYHVNTKRKKVQSTRMRVSSSGEQILINGSVR